MSSPPNIKIPGQVKRLIYREVRDGQLRDTFGNDDWLTALAHATYNLNHKSRDQLGGETSASVKRWENSVFWHVNKAKVHLKKLNAADIVFVTPLQRIGRTTNTTCKTAIRKHHI